MVEPLEGELANLTIELAFQYGVTIYDASYIAISEEGSVILLLQMKKYIQN